MNFMKSLKYSEMFAKKNNHRGKSFASKTLGEWENVSESSPTFTSPILSE